MATEREEMMRVLDFILNRSDRAEIEVIQEAVERRVRDLTEGGARLNISGLAHMTGKAVQDQLGPKGQIHSMMRRFVQELVKQHQPDISDEAVSKILDEYVPDEEAQEKGREDRYPRAAVLSMVVQFVDYGLGRMKPEEKAQLAPDWSRKYWNVFGSRTRRLIADFLKGSIDEETFWRDIKAAE